MVQVVSAKQDEKLVRKLGVHVVVAEVEQIYVTLLGLAPHKYVRKALVGFSPTLLFAPQLMFFDPVDLHVAHALED